MRILYLAEREGFEPPVPFSTSVFKTGAIDHSATSPGFLLCQMRWSLILTLQRYSVFFNRASVLAKKCMKKNDFFCFCLFWPVKTGFYAVFLCVSCVCAVLLFIGIVIIFFLIFVVRFVVWHVIFTPYSYCGVAVLYGEGLLVAKKGYRFVLLFFL